MTVNYSFDLEDDDFLDDTLRSIPEKDLLSCSISSPACEIPVNNNELKDFQAAGPSKALEHSVANTVNKDRNRKNSLSFLFNNRESVSGKHEDIDFSEISSPKKSASINKTTKINSRFVPGVTPKAKRRKLPGPAGFFSENDDQNSQPVNSEHSVTKDATADIEIQNITNSQFSSEDLLLSSWQNLQADVSSSHSLLSTAKYYSIRRVLHETSKKKLPKHLVVPVLCVLIKKLNAEESSLLLVDDTGEIAGKIEKEVLDMYKDVIQEKTALILKRVTCICNILLLKKQNVVSIYREDGSVEQVQDLSSILDKEEPLKPMNCQCPGTPDQRATPKMPSVKKTVGATGKRVAPSSCKKENSCHLKSPSRPQVPIGKEKMLNILESVLDVSKRDCGSENSPSRETSSNVTLNNSASTSDEITNFASTPKMLNTETNPKWKQKSSAANIPGRATSEEDLFCEDADDFDDILCSLDEKSFLQES